MRKSLVSAIVVTACAIGLTACGDMPDLTNEQSEMIAEYSASLLLKYDSENHSRLTDTTVFMNQYNMAKKIHDDAEAAYFENLRLEEEERLNELEEQEEANNQTQEMVAEETDDGTGGAEVVSNMTIGEAIGAPEVTIEYAGSDLLNHYPEETDEYYFTIDASKGSRLLVIYFNMKNTSNQTVSLDVMDRDVKFKISVNDGKAKGALTTMMEDDLKEYVGDLAAGETKRVVLISEVAEGTSVDTISLTVKTDTGSINKILK